MVCDGGRHAAYVERAFLGSPAAMPVRCRLNDQAVFATPRTGRLGWVFETDSTSDTAKGWVLGQTAAIAAFDQEG